MTEIMKPHAVKPSALRHCLPWTLEISAGPFGIVGRYEIRAEPIEVCQNRRLQNRQKTVILNAPALARETAARAIFKLPLNCPSLSVRLTRKGESNARGSMAVPRRLGSSFYKIVFR